MVDKTWVMNQFLQRSFLFFCLIFLPVVYSFSQVWTQKANYPGQGRSRPFSFSIGLKGYFGTGDANGYAQDFWEYDPLTNTWSQKANFGGGTRWCAAGFSVGGKGYAGTGIQSGWMSDIWEYDPTLNSWTQVANFAGGTRIVPVAISIGNKGYMGCGRDASSQCMNDFWEYDASLNTWSQKANVPGVTRSQPSGFSMGGYGYVGLGFDQAVAGLGDFYKYDPVLNTWTPIANFLGVPRGDASGFNIGSLGYIGTGQQLPPYNTVLNDFWSYDPVADAWSPEATFGGVVRDETGFFSIGNRGYIGVGGHNGTAYYNDFWEYSGHDSNLVSVNEKGNAFSHSIYPNPMESCATIEIHPGNLTICDFKLFDLNGKLVKEQTLESNTSEIERGDLGAGLYVYTISTKNKILASGKLLVE